MHAYLNLLLKHPREIGFGLFLTFVASFGQTYFIAVFGAELRAAFGLTSGGFGSVYSAATLASALTLVQLGRVVDRWSAGRCALLAIAGLAAGTLLLALSHHVVLLGLALYLLRLSGQGMMVHIALTTLARRFSVERGRAVGAATLGVAAGEMLFPLLGVAVLELGWRTGWALSALVLLLAAAPLALWLGRSFAAPQAARGEAGEAADAGWSRAQVLRDGRFWLMLPGLLAPAIIITGVFFHQVVLVSEKGWSLATFASSFSFYALAAVGGSLVAGAMVDRLGATRMLPLLPLFQVAALVLLAFASSPVLAFVSMALMGGGNSAQSTTVNALWPELYGTRHLGAIRAMAGALMVFGSALSPASFGLVLDAGLGMSSLLLGSAVFGLAGAGLFLVALRRPPLAAAQRR
ncbi:MFS transporter [Marinimicrococcus flavescens]|uniref:MFS transporter n=1 Tax=Marinimicrococcus flavescens TaxID=3031815 RepID=A0AAP3XRH8_9PROT|nr:MFS transporter [Marinimicrococcus flavescens]